MNNALLALPIVLPLAGAALGLLAWRRLALQRAISIGASALLVVAAGMLLAVVRRDDLVVAQIAAWPAPYGIAFVGDLLGATMVFVASLIGLAIAIYAQPGVDLRRQAYGFHPLLQLVVAGSCGAFLTGDVFNLFVWIEVQLSASFVLVALGNERVQLEGAIKYVTLNLVASALLLAAVGLLYGMTGTLSFADISARLAGGGEPDGVVEGPLAAAALLLVIAFGIKAAVFPFFFWLPASYGAPPAAVTALFSALLTKVGVYAMIRSATSIFGDESELASALLVAFAAPTMIIGVLGAAAQTDVRRILSFHIVSQIGYAVMGLAISGTLGLGGAIFFVVHNIFAKAALLLVAGIVERVRGTGELSRLGGLAGERPLLAILFLVPALSLAGIPPLGGFVAKLVLVRASIEAEEWGLLAAALGVSLLTLYSMAKIWIRAFWTPALESAAAAGSVDAQRVGVVRPVRAPRTMMATAAAIGAVTILLSIFARPAMDLSLDAAAQILDREAYAERVLRAGGAR